MKIPFCLIRLLVGMLVAFSAMSCQRQGVEASREKTSDLTPQKILSIDDETFLLAAQKAEIRQTTLSEVALDVSKNEEVRNYAKQVVTNYRKALAELTDLMRAKNIPNVSATAEAIRLEAMNRLHGLSGSTFDHEFISLMAAEQQAALASCNLTAETAADPDIRNYAKGVLPLLREDFNTVTGLSKKLAAGELR